MKVENRAAAGSFIRPGIPAAANQGTEQEGGGLNPRGLIATNFPPIRSGFQRKKRRRKTVYL